VSGKRFKKKSLIPTPQGNPEGASITRVRTEIQSFSGPLPPPEVLARYNEVVTNGAERILAMAERQSAHRESLESRVVDGNLAIQKSGSLRAFILALVVILGGIYLMATGKDAWGFAAIVTSLASLVSVFLIGKTQQKKERIDKSNALEARRRQ
jgi:uncharacterized membrane protein